MAFWQKLFALKNQDGEAPVEPEPSTPIRPEMPEVLKSVRGQHPNLSNFHKRSQSMAVTPHPPGQFDNGQPSTSTPRSSSPTKRSRLRFINPGNLSGRKSIDVVDSHSDSVNSIVVISGHEEDRLLAEPGMWDVDDGAVDVPSTRSGDLGGPSSSPSLPYDSPSVALASRMSQHVGRELQGLSDGKGVSATSIPAVAHTSNPHTPSNAPGVRSILRPPQTPGTGQSVRFGEHNAFRIISPEASSVSSVSKAEVSSVERHLRRRDDISSSFLNMPSDEDQAEAVSALELSLPRNALPAQQALRTASDINAYQPTERSQSSSISFTRIPQLPDDMSNLNQLNLSHILDDSQLDTHQSSDESVVVPPFAQVSPGVLHSIASVPTGPEVATGFEVDANSTVYHSTIVSPSHISVETPEPSVVQGSPDLSFSAFLPNVHIADSHPLPTSSTRRDLNLNDASPPRAATPLGSTPDASAYLSSADFRSPYDRRDDSRRSLGLGRQSSKLSIPPLVPSTSSATSSSADSNSTGPSIPSTTTSEPEVEYVAGRVFSRTMQPIEGTVAGIPESRSQRTIVGEWSPMTPEPSSYALAIGARYRSYPATPDKSLAIPGKFKFDLSSYATASPSVIVSEASPFEDNPDAGSMLQAYEGALNHLRSQNLVLSQLDEMRSSERKQIREWVTSLMEDLRLLGASDSDAGQGDSSKVDPDSSFVRKAESEELKHAVAAAEAALQAEHAKRILWEQDKQELEIRWEQERQRFDKELRDLKEELDTAREAGTVLEEKNDELEELREAVAGHHSKVDDSREARDRLEERNSALRQELHERDGELDSLRNQLATFTQQERGLTIHPSNDDTAILHAQLDAASARMSDLRNKTAELERDLQKQTSSASDVKEQVKVLQAELEAQWANTEKETVKIEKLEADRRSLLNQLRNLKQETQSKETEAKRELASQLREAWERRDAAEREREELASTLEGEVEKVRAEIEELHDQYEAECQEHDMAREECEQLGRSHEALLKERDDALQSARRLDDLVHKQVKELSAATGRVLEREKEADALRGEMMQLRRQHERDLQEQQRELDDAIHRASQAEAQLNTLIRQRATEGVMSEGVQGRLQVLNDEVAKLRHEVMELQAANADKELMLTKLTKAKDQYKEDKEGLNLALEAKQHELDLLKRKYGLKGVAGANTPVPNRVSVSRPPSRESLVFTPAHRPSSSLTDNKDRRTTLGTADPLRTSLRSSTTASRRYSTLATPTPSSALPKSALSKSQSIAPAPRRPSSLASSTTSHRRVSSGSLPARGRIPEALRIPSGMVSLQSVEDKENEEPVEEPTGDMKAKRRSVLLEGAYLV